jgi:hypothetical protein
MEASYRPVLVFRTAEDAEPMRGYTTIDLCFKHRATVTLGDILDDERWQQIVDTFEEHALTPPQRQLTELVFEEIGDESPLGASGLMQ